MPNLKTSIKDLRQTGRKTVYNDRLRTRVKKAVKRVNDLVVKGEKAKAQKALVNASKVLDKAAKKNVIKDGKADRLKGRLTKKLNKIAQNNVKAANKSA